MDQAERSAQVVSLLRSLGHGSALVGGLAVSVRARERFTRDIDFAVAVESDQQAETLALAMQRLGFQLLTVVEQEARGVLATLRFRHPGDRDVEPTIDLLCGSSGIEPEVVERAEPVQLSERVTVPVACLADLIALKVLSESDVRDQDRADLRALITIASEEELAAAAAALDTIQERGFDRGKDLASCLAELVVRFGG